MLLSKVKNDNKGSDVAFLGVAMILFVILVIGSFFDFWLLTYAKEKVVSKVQLMELSAISEYFDYTDASYRQDPDQYFTNNCRTFIIDKFNQYFNDTFTAGGKSLFKKIELLQAPNCYLGKGKVIFDSGQIVFSLRRMLPITDRQVPLLGGYKNQPYLNNPQEESVYSRVRTCVKVLFD